jgi:hypothetical protein
MEVNIEVNKSNIFDCFLGHVAMANNVEHCST